MASIALHAVVLSLSAPASKQAVTSPGTVVARIVKPAPPAESPVPERKTSLKKAAPALAAAPVTPIADSASAAQYRQQLIGVAVRYKVYPPHAVQNGWEGDVAIGVSIAASGASQVSVMKSSGHGLLDEQALEMFRLAAPRVPVPQALRGRQFAVEVRAVYSLRE